MLNKTMLAIFIMLMAIFIGKAKATDYSFQYERNVEGVVAVWVNPDRFGTGFFFQDRFILTAAHVIGDGKNPQVTISGNDYPEFWKKVNVVFLDLMNDVAILEMNKIDWLEFKIMEKPTNLELSSSKVITGQETWGIGNRSNFRYHFFAGNISKANDIDQIRRNNIHWVDLEFFQGDSGGPHFDALGRVIGITRSFISPGQGTKIPMDNMEIITSGQLIRKAILDFVNNAKQPFRAGPTGTEWEIDIDGEIFLQKIDAVNILSKKIGWQVGDRALRINGQPVRNLNELDRHWTMIAKGDNVKFEVMRKGKPFRNTVQF